MNISPQVAQLYDKVKSVILPAEWSEFAPDVDAILALKREKNAVILAHNYQTPEIFHGVADIVGDSLALAREAMKTDADIIVLAGVHFMAETAKLLNPSRTVLIPDLRAGCSLAESITAQDVRLLRQRWPGVPIVTYVNTSAAVKAESDICCTSGNAKKIVESLGVPKVIMLPDEYLAQNIARETDVEIITWAGHCEVHERFSAADVRQVRAGHPGVVVLARGGGRGRFLGLDRGDGRLCRARAAGPRRADDRMLDERQHRGIAPRDRVRAAVQPLPAHEAHHPAQDPPRARNHEPRGDDRSRHRRPGPPRRRAHAGRPLRRAP
jgi:hypothetical protein